MRIKRILYCICRKAVKKIVLEILFFIFWIMYQRAKKDIKNLDSVNTLTLTRAVDVTRRNMFINSFFESALTLRQELQNCQSEPQNCQSPELVK